jgi:hypothetical protein
MFAMNRTGLAPFRTTARLALTAPAPLAAAGCLSLGPHTLQVDQADYARALGEAKKQEILTLIVGLRYADSPALLTITQVISGYTFTASATPMSESVPPGPTAALTGMAYAAVRYRSSRFWIDDSDFDSKYALTVVQDLMALAEETDVSHAPIVTVPAS